MKSINPALPNSFSSAPHGVNKKNFETPTLSRSAFENSKVSHLDLFSHSQQHLRTHKGREYPNREALDYIRGSVNK